MNIGLTIKELRKQKGFSQTEFAELVGLKQTSLSQIETGLTTPHKSSLERIAKALDIPEYFLYLLSVDEKDVPAHKRELFQKFFPSVKELMMNILTDDKSKS